MLLLLQAAAQAANYPMWRFYVIVTLLVLLGALLIWVAVLLVRFIRQVKGDLSVVTATAQSNAALAADNSRLRGELHSALTLMASLSERFGLAISQDLERVRERQNADLDVEAGDLP